MHWSRFFLQTKLSHQILMFLSGECAMNPTVVSYILCIIFWVSRFLVVYIQTASFMFINASLASFKISQENHFWNCITKVLSTPNILLHFKPALTARNYIWRKYFFASWKITCAQATFLFVYPWRTKWNDTESKEGSSNKQGLLCLRCHCLGLGYVMHVHSLCLPLITSHANLQFFGPRYVMHVDSLCLPFLHAHANLQFGSFFHVRRVTYSNSFCKVLLINETLSPVSGHTIDSLGGTPATFMVESWQGC